MSPKSRSFVALVVVLGAATLVAAVVNEHVRRPGGLALLAAAAILTELFEIEGGENAFDGRESHSFSFSSSVHLAAVMIVGPWQAALVAAVGVLVVDCLRGAALPRVAFNTATFALATLCAGALYEACGATPGQLSLPSDLLPIAVMAFGYTAVNRTLVAAVVSLTSRRSMRHLLADALRSDLLSATGEASLGVVLAFFVLSNPWQVVVIAPLALAVYQAHKRLALLKEETTRALETFASVVDERDPTTYRHSERVAEHVERLAEALALPAPDVARLRWAGRLHDLGKIAVDAALLRKPGGLDEREWDAMRRHPRLSARLLRRFRFAALATQAVEYHHERYDSAGYYGIERKEIPLAAHLLIVADSYDAMVSDRPYRRGLSKADALRKIEAGSGAQFHPTVAKAFVAMQRGLDPRAVLDPAEQTELRDLSLRSRSQLPWARRLRAARPETLAIPGIAAAVAAAGLGHATAAVALAGSTVVVLAYGRRRTVLRSRLRAALESALREARSPQERLRAYVDRVAGTASVRWAALVRWEEELLTGTVETELPLAEAGPTVTGLTSWLARDEAAAGNLLVGPGSEVGCAGTCLAAPVVGHTGRTDAYLVFLFAGVPPRHVQLAIGDSRPELAALAPAGARIRRLTALASAG